MDSTAHEPSDGAAAAPSGKRDFEVTAEHQVVTPSGHNVTFITQDYTGPPAPPAGPPPPPAYGETRNVQASTTSLSSLFMLCNCAVGAGMLSLPLAFQKTVALSTESTQWVTVGLVLAILLCILVGSLQGLTLYVLSKFAERYEASTYNELVRKALGRKLAALLSVIMVFYLLGSASAYQIIVGDTFTSLAAQLVGPDSILQDRRLIVLTANLLVILPLCLPRRIGFLAAFSAGAVVLFFYSAVVIVIRGLQQAEAHEVPLEDVKLFNLGFGTLYAIPIFVYGFNCHSTVVPIFHELSSNPHRLISFLPASPAMYQGLPSYAPKPRTHKLIGMLGVIIGSFVTIMAGYIAVGVAGYMAFPLMVKSNILNSFGQDDVVVQVARGAISIVVLAHYPLTHFPARAAFEHLLQQTLQLSYIPWRIPLLFTVTFVTASMSIGLFVTNLGDVLHLIGGTAACFMIFFLPGLLMINGAVVKDSSLLLAEQEIAGPAHALPSSSESLHVPLLAETAKRGIKKTGLIYSQRRSWALGVCLVLLSVAVFCITCITVVVH